jgi:hypothetical protein
MLYRGLALAIALACAGCTQKIVKNIDAYNQIGGRTDGAVIGYYPPKAIWKFAVGYDASTGLVTVTPDAKPTILPDTSGKMYWLSYAHAGLSDDDIDIKVDNSMLSMVASKSSDQTVKIVEAANTLISQFGTTKSALEKAKIEAAVGGGESTLPDDLKNANCKTNLKSEVTINLSTLKSGSQRDLQWAEFCSLDVDVSATRLGIVPYKTSIERGRTFQAAQDLSAQDICERAVCFRPSQVVQVKVIVRLKSNFVDKDGKALKAKGDKSYTVRLPKAGEKGLVAMTYAQLMNPVTVPAASAGMAFIEFGRRAFVENHTSINFTDGVVNEFKSTDPSIIAGALTLSSDLLKTVVFTIPIVK